MKKSNKPEINSEELLKDFDKVMSFISKMENQDLTKVIESTDETNLQDQAACAGGACEIV